MTGVQTCALPIRTFEYSTDAIEVSPGDYDVVVVCDVDNAWSNRWWDAIGPNEFKVTDATILDEPADPVYKLWSSVTAVAQDGSNPLYVVDGMPVGDRKSVV